MKNIINLFLRYMFYFFITIKVKLHGDIKEQIEFKEELLDFMFE